MPHLPPRRLGNFHPGTWLMAVLLAVPLGAGAQDATKPGADASQPPSLPALQQKVQEAYGAENYDEALEYLGRMAQRMPFDGKLMYETAATHALNGNLEQAFHMLITLQRQGLNFSPRGDERFEPLSGYPLFDHMAGLLEQNGEPFDKADTAMTVEADLKWPQAIARHGSDGDFFLAGLGQGRILRVSPAGTASRFFEPGEDGPEGITALAVDADRGVLWAAGTAVRQDGQGVSINMQAAALYRLDLESGELQAHFPITDDKPLPHLFNEIAVGPDGSVYAADALSPLIYHHEPGQEALEAFVGAPGLSGFRGIDVTPDGKYLLVSEWFTGLYRVSVSKRRAHRLDAGPFVNLGGIHSLSFRDGKLFAVQTGTKPDRVMRIHLSDALDRAEAMFPLSASEPEYDRPGLGVLAGDGYYFVADSRWSLNEGSGEAGETITILKANPELGSGAPLPGISAKAGSPIEGNEAPDGFVDPEEPAPRDTEADDADPDR